jgi:aquaporin NIP
MAGERDESQDQPGKPSRGSIPLSRKLAAELVGTFLLTFASIAPKVLEPGLGIRFPDPVVAVAPAMVVAIVIYAFGDVSGAHINPAVTLGFTLRRAFPWRRLPAYWLAQVVGAVLAALLMRLRFGSSGQLRASQPYAGTGTALAAETLLSTLLVLVILNVSTRESLLGGGAAVPMA